MNDYVVRIHFKELANIEGEGNIVSRDVSAVDRFQAQAVAVASVLGSYGNIKISEVFVLDAPKERRFVVSVMFSFPGKCAVFVNIYNLYCSNKDEACKRAKEITRIVYSGIKIEIESVEAVEQRV